MKSNKKNKRLLLLIIVTLCTSIGLYAYLPAPRFRAPDVTLKTITNNTVQLKQLQGKVVLVTFWATDCPSCLKEIPHLKSLYQNYHQQGLEIFAIASYYDPPNHVVDASKTYQIPYGIVLDLRMKLASAFGDVRLTPTTFLISPAGEIVYQITGSFDFEAMQARIESYLSPQGTH